MVWATGAETAVGVAGTAVGVIAVGHDILEAEHVFDDASSRTLELSFLPAAFFFIPAIYAALNFGTVGAIATAAWCVVISLPNMFLLWSDQDWTADLVQLVAVSGTGFFVSQRTDREVAARHRAELATEALRSEEKLRQASLRAYAANILRAQEDERQRIARDLHDQTVQELVLLCRQIDLIEGAENASANVVQGMIVARGSAEKVADDLGLVTAVRGLVADVYERSNIDGDVTVDGDEQRLSGDVELAFFRVIQEAIHNVERHAKASRVDVTFRFANNDVQVDIDDDGAGFTLASTSDFAATGHLGLMGMRERAENLGGQCVIRSQLGHGTRVSVRLGDVVDPRGSVGVGASRWPTMAADVVRQLSSRPD